MLALALQHDEIIDDEIVSDLLALAKLEHGSEQPAANDPHHPHAPTHAATPPRPARIPAPILYEEYHPFGTSAYRAVSSTVEVSAKRYRYTGKERDEETGLDHMGARYYAGWLGRWTAADPIGLGDGVNRYAYVRGNPVGMRDPSGTAALTADQQKIVDANALIDATATAHNAIAALTEERHKAMSHPVADAPTLQEQYREQVKQIERERFETLELPLIRAGKKVPAGVPETASPVYGRTGIEGFADPEAIRRGVKGGEGYQYYDVRGTPVGELEYQTTSAPGEVLVSLVAGGLTSLLRGGGAAALQSFRAAGAGRGAELGKGLGLTQKELDDFLRGEFSVATAAKEGGSTVPRPVIGAVRDEAYTSSRHTLEGKTVVRDLAKGREAHVFDEGVDLAALEAKVWTEGTSQGTVRGFQRFTYESPTPIGRRIQAGKPDVPLHTVEIKGKLGADDTWTYHLVPRTRAAR